MPCSARGSWPELKREPGKSWPELMLLVDPQKADRQVLRSRISASPCRIISARSGSGSRSCFARISATAFSSVLRSARTLSMNEAIGNDNYRAHITERLKAPPAIRICSRPSIPSAARGTSYTLLGVGGRGGTRRLPSQVADRRRRSAICSFPRTPLGIKTGQPRSGARSRPAVTLFGLG